MPDEKNLFTGLMSGTGMDAVDVALAAIIGATLNVIDYHQYPAPVPPQKAAGNLSDTASLHDVSELDATMAELFAGAVTAFAPQTTAILLCGAVPLTEVFVFKRNISLLKIFSCLPIWGDWQ